MPDPHKLPNRGVRIGPEWDDAIAEAARRGETLTAYLRRAIRWYNDGGDIQPNQKRARK